MSLATLRTFAEKNIITYDILKKMVEGTHPPAGDFPGYILNTDKSRIVFSIEDQKGLLCRHASISFPSNTNPSEINKLIKEYLIELGFNLKTPFHHIWEESTPFGVALNYLQVMP